MTTNNQEFDRNRETTGLRRLAPGNFLSKYTAILRIAFKRMAQEWRTLGILLFAICLVTGFLALGPLYIRGVTEVDLRFALDNATQNQLNVNVISDQPLGPEQLNVVEERLGGLVTDVEYVIRADYTPPQNASGQGGTGLAGTATSGIAFELGENPLVNSPNTPHFYQPFAFPPEELTDRVTIVEGRLPQRLAPPEEISPQAVSNLSVDEQQELEVGYFNRGQTEAIVSTAVAEEAELEIGTRFFIGQRFIDGTGQIISVKIVGIVEINDPTDPYWSGNTMFLTGAEIPIGNLGLTRFDFGLAFDPGAYTDWVADVVPGTSYIWALKTDPDVINADNAGDVNDNIGAIRTQLGQNDPTIQVFSGYSNLISGFDNRVTDAEGPIIFLSAAVMVLLLYHLITTVGLVLQQQGKEWSTITSRGGSTPQLFVMQFATIFILGFISFFAAFGISRLFLLFMQEFGPLARVLGDATIVNIAFPDNSIYLALAGAISATVVLSLPSIPAATRSLLSLKQAASRPPTKPVWATFYLDVTFLVIGLALIFRLYANANPGVEFTQLFNNIADNPSGVITSIEENLTGENGLEDPFNVAAAPILLTGLALLWLRFFPMLVGFISKFASRSNNLTTPLAVWNVERDPGHYSQLVLLLIFTLALGTASLGLQETREIGAWQEAVNDVGGGARVDIDPGADIADQPWDRLDGVEDYASILSTQVDPTRDGNVTVQVIGVDPEQFADAYPQYADKVEALQGAETLQIPGTPLDADARRLSVQVWSGEPLQPDDPLAEVQLKIYLVDAVGIPFVTTLERPSFTQSAAAGAGDDSESDLIVGTPINQWVQLEGNLPVTGRAPYQVWQIGIATRQGTLSAFDHTLYLDYWQTLDENGVATTFEDFEVAPDSWQRAISRNPYAIAGEEVDPFSSTIGGIETFEYVDVSTENIEPVVSGDNQALKLVYRVRNTAARTTEPSIAINPSVIDTIPAVVSQDFTRTFRGDGRSAVRGNTPNLRLGDQRYVQMDVGPGTVDVELTVVDIIEDFPTIEDSDQFFIIVPLDTISLWFNQTARPNNSFGVNQIWLDIPEQEPTQKLKDELATIDGIRNVTYTFDRYGAILRDALPAAVAGMLYAGFFISLALSLLDFAFYLAVTAQQRSFTFGVLRSLGWNANNIWRLLFVEQVTLITPALIIGSILGLGLAFIILPFLSLVGDQTLVIPTGDYVLMIVGLIAAFTFLLVMAALWLRSMSVNQVLRLGEE